VCYQVSAELGLPYREGLVKNRYVGRTFIMPDQRMREMSVRRKLNAMPAVFEGKNVLLIDDSIVRGTTMAQIVDMVRRAGAKKVSPGRHLTVMLASTFVSYW
jgi:amidophosphoribosyltransferase